MGRSLHVHLQPEKLRPAPTSKIGVEVAENALLFHLRTILSPANW